MTTPTMSPPGWYADPSGRHESRYWDGSTWTKLVADQGVATTESVEPGQPPAPPPGPAGPVSGYRVRGVSRGRVAAVKTAQIATVLAFFYEAVASVYLGWLANRGVTVTLPSRGSFQWSSWLYRYGARVVVYGYPPLGVWLALLLAMVTAGALTLTPLQAVKKAGYPGWTARSALAERARLIQGLRQVGCSETLLRARGRRGLLVAAEVGALAVIGFAIYAMTAKHGLLLESQTSTRTLTVGAGPVVCLVAGIVAAVAIAIAWPWQPERALVVFADGSLRTESPRTEQPQA